jgi:hypothetical protein
MAMVKPNNLYGHPDVMISSTYSDLREHREAVDDALHRLGFFSIGMEYDSAKAGKDVIASSLEMVTKAQAYVGILSHRYGGVPKDVKRNPQKLSITELEYREALKRGIPVYMFLMSDEYPVPPKDIETAKVYRKKLEALKDDARSHSICAVFSSVAELKSLVLQSMIEFKEQLAQSLREAESAQDQPRGKAELELASPPNLLALPDFISGHEFVGRRAELAWLDEWATSGESLMVIEAIGGAGKSTLAWQWLKEQVSTVRPDLAGVMWYSFYEGGADMSAFAAYALTYMTGRPLKEFYGRKTADLARLLIAVLHERPFLLVLDGLERVLVAYNRLDASQARDDQVASDRSDRACIKPADSDLLRQLVASNPSKILITSRLMPTALTNRTGLPLPGAWHHYLGGLHSDDALTMMRRIGVHGNQSTIQRYLKENFDNHPLLVGIVAGLVNDYIREPGNFDRWADDPQGGAALNLAKLDLSQRRTHILAAALNGLEPGARQLLSRIAALGDAVPFETVAALNPFLPPPPKLNEEIDAEYEAYRLEHLESLRERASGEEERNTIVREISEAHARIEQAEAERAAHVQAMEEYRGLEEGLQALPKLVSSLQDLEQRGLLQWDRKKNSYDLHPVVRGYAFDILEQTEREDICNRIVDHFQSKPADRYDDAKTLTDVQQSISIFRLLVQAHRFDDAVDFFQGNFVLTLLYSVEAYHETLALLKPLFPDGFQKPPSTLMDKSDQSYLLNEAANALKALNRVSDAQEAYIASLQLYLVAGSLSNTAIVLLNIAEVYFRSGRISASFAARELSLEIYEAYENTQGAATPHLAIMGICSLTGLFERAEAAYNAFQQLPIPTDRAIYRPGDAEASYCWLRFYQGRLTGKQLNEAEIIAQSGNNRWVMRGLEELRGELALQHGDVHQAITGFERAIEMAQTVGVPVGRLEARLALAKAIAGDREQAREICDRLSELAQPPDVELAAAYLEIGDRDKAREHALKGYRWAWAEGPPYSYWWQLEQCRAVLKALGEPEPNLPAFDPKAVEPLPFEAEIRKLIAELKGKKKKKRKPS